MWKWSVVVAVGLALTGALMPLALPRPPSRVTWANFERVKVGMSREEVEALLGPPGDYRTAPTAVLQLGPLYSPEGKVERWKGDEGWVEVGVDEHAVVTGKKFQATGKAELSAWGRVKWRLRRCLDLPDE
jgi:hypothetical protein